LQYYALVVLANPSDDVAGFELVKPVFAVYALVLGEGFLVLLFGFVQRLQLIGLDILYFA
jgi:hypothetical protein|tara:strand:- start:140 stop:319 length:180 start_codon:yes stop_codon:yes gene_type:complete